MKVCFGANTYGYTDGGGHVWEYLNWALGLSSLGCEVIWLEPVPDGETETGLAANEQALRERLQPYGLEDSLDFAHAGRPVEAADGDDDALVVHRGERAFVLLNKYPYASGHVMVAPTRHEEEFGALDADEALEVHRLASVALGVLAETMRPQGFNLGWNLGRIAGAGVVDHVHLHVVPRWAGDTNFMPVLADVKVLPESLAAARAKLADAWPGA
jgi:ATP adenylyltransferase